MSLEDDPALSFAKPRGPFVSPTRFIYAMNCGPEAGMSEELIGEVFGEFGHVEKIVPVGDNGTRVVVVFSSEEASAAAFNALNLRTCEKAGGRMMRLEYAELRTRPHVNQFPVAMSDTELGISGLSLHLDFVSPEEEQELLEAVDQRPWQVLSRRRVQHYGYEFEYKIRNVDRNRRLGDLPVFVSPLVRRLEVLPELTEHEEPCLPLDQLTVNEYPVGVGLSPHVDTHTAFEGALLSLSLSGPCIMQFRRPLEQTGDNSTESIEVNEVKENGEDIPEEDDGSLCSTRAFEKRTLFLPERSLLVLRGEARYAWSHYIPHHKVDIVNGESIKRKSRRISFTFRKVRHGPCHCAYPQECDGQQAAASLSNVSMVSDITCCALNGGSFDTEHQNASVNALADGLQNNIGTEKLESRSNEPGKNENRLASEGSVRDSDNGCDGISTSGACQDVSEELQGSHGKAMENEEPQCEESISNRTPDVERTFVHQVYDAIAPHFSSTRFAKWPKVAEFLNSLSPGSLVADVGCGNGKYLGFNPSCSFIGCDISPSLVGICSRHGFQVLTADGLRLPYRSNVFDATISIAVLHHLSTGQRRRQALLELVRVVKRGGKVLITVWAREQEDSSLIAKWTPLSGRHTERWIDMPEINRLNQSVPMDGIPEGNISPKETSISTSAQSLGDGVGKNSLSKANEVGQEGYNEDYKEPSLKQLEIGDKPVLPNVVEQEYFVPWHLPYHRAEIGGASAQALLTGFARKDDKKGAVVYNRYYHVFTQGELERLASEVDGAVIDDSFYDKSNWCIILRKL